MKELKQTWVRLKAGEPKALSELYDAMAERLYAYGYALLPHAASIEDCLQELFLDLWSKRHQLPVVDQVSSYLLVAMRHRVMSVLRKRTPTSLDAQDPIPSSVQASPEAQFIAQENEAEQIYFLHEALNQLPARMQEALKLRYFEGLEYPEIAQVMEVSQQVAVNMVYRAVKRLRQQVGKMSSLVFWWSLGIFLSA